LTSTESWTWYLSGEGKESEILVFCSSFHHKVSILLEDSLLQTTFPITLQVQFQVWLLWRSPTCLWSRSWAGSFFQEKLLVECYSGSRRDIQ
jgi:hypothetical protein